MRIRCAWLSTILFGACATLRAQPLHSPWQNASLPVLNTSAYDCPIEPRLPRVLSFDSYYTDAHHSIKDPAAEQAYHAAVTVPEDFARRDGLRQVTPEGTLPLEMERASMALHYHLFAAAALVLLAELAEFNGFDLYNENGGALRRLVLRAASGLADPPFFAKRTGVPQQPQDLGNAGIISWGRPFARRFPNPILDELLAKTPQKGYWMFGGVPPP